MKCLWYEVAWPIGINEFKAKYRVGVFSRCLGT